LLVAFAGELSADNIHDENFFLGAVLIFSCAITFALYIVGSGRIIPLVGAAKFNSYAMSFAAAGVLLHYLISSSPSLTHLGNTVYLYAFLMAIISTVIPSYLISEGIKRIGSGNAAIIASVGPVSTIVQAYIFLDEPILAMQIGGTVLILIGVMLVGWKPRRNLA
jgi:drug/metabolite transporter (DMT)-like permease